jgi:murein DD-endopeptidase MepM/ murein hydrolase activator NlpD
MIDSSEMIEGVAVCGLCKSSLLTRRYVQSLGRSSFYILCSKECARVAARAQRRARWVTRRRNTRRLTLGIIFAGAYLTPHQGTPKTRPAYRATLTRPAQRPASPPLPSGWFGPEWPPTEAGVLEDLGRDAWIHPLAGPIRRMPRSDARVFGAVRPGDRAVECRNGHCGVDLGGEIWGEHVHAVHDGVVDWVKRGVNPDRGGQFVRLSHRDGTVFTQYFHLAAIARGIERGAIVKSGDVIGLLGDTGVKESGPHLHFTISVRPSKPGPETYIDPEPLIALWPLHVPVDGSEVGLVTTVARPGVPLGSALLIPGRKRKLGRQTQTQTSDQASQSERTKAASTTSRSADEPSSAGAASDEPQTED